MLFFPYCHKLFRRPELEGPWKLWQSVETVETDRRPALEVLPSDNPTARRQQLDFPGLRISVRPGSFAEMPSREIGSPKGRDGLNGL